MYITKEKLTVLGVALAFDRLGEPPGIIHPVVWYGRLIKFLEKRAPEGKLAQLAYGAAMPVIAAPCVILPVFVLQRFCTGKSGTEPGRASWSLL